MAENKETFEVKMSRLEQREKRAWRRSLILTAIPLIVGIAWLIYSVNKIEDSQRKLEDEQQIAVGLEEILNTSDPYRAAASATPEGFDKQKILSKVNGKRKQALELAFMLGEQSIPFQWGGKKPEKGFDSSGFTAYVLNEVNIISKPETYYTGKLKEKFGIITGPGLPPDTLQPGDLIFYEPTAVMFYLDDKHCLGMVPPRIFVRDINFGLKYIGYSKVLYE